MPKNEDYKIRMRKKEERDKGRAQNGGDETKRKRKKKKEQPGYVQRGVQVNITFSLKW
jgi:hypothetical protein